MDGGSKLLGDLLQARKPAVYFANNIGDSILTLPTVRALGQMFAAPLTVICPKFAFDLCFWEVSPHHVDITGLLPHRGPPQLQSHRTVDCETVVSQIASQIGAVDVFINTEPWNMPSNTFLRPLRQRLAPAKTIGFPNHLDDYDIVITREMSHSADLIFKLARLFDPSLRIETFAGPVSVSPTVQEEVRSIRAALPKGTRVLVVHTDSGWVGKQWPITRFIDLLDRFLSRHRDFVAWVIGMGHEELNVGRERERVLPHLGLPLDLAVGMVSSADLFVGVDSSMLHAADLARVPGVGLFGPTRPTTWGFRFAPHRHVDVRMNVGSTVDMKTMADITVDEVLGAMEDLVEGST